LLVMAALCRCWGAPYSLDFSLSISRWLQWQASNLKAIKHDGCPLHSQRNAWRYCTAVSDCDHRLISAQLTPGGANCLPEGYE
jgi:hypothetical protein